jgi:hypothetical protein
MKKWFSIGILLLLALIAVSPQWGALSSALQQTLDNPPVYIPMVGRAGVPTVAPPTPTPPTPTLPAPDGLIVVNHTNVDLFDDIPANYVQAAANIQMIFSNRSVGDNINQGLDCLSTPYETAASSCLRANTDPRYPVADTYMFWEGTYPRNNWSFTFEDGAYYWEITDDFLNRIAPTYLNTKQVLSFQFSYLAVADYSTIASTTDGYFVNQANRYDVYDVEQFFNQHPDKTYIFWTSSLARSIGNRVSMDFNQQMRNYAANRAASGKPTILFDVADILSHTPDGRPCYDNRDGVPYLTENYPDDGYNYPAICQEYTVETDGGHLIGSGKIRVAKGFWVLMAQIAGWNP